MALRNLIIVYKEDFEYVANLLYAYYSRVETLSKDDIYKLILQEPSIQCMFDSFNILYTTNGILDKSKIAFLTRIIESETCISTLRLAYLIEADRVFPILSKEPMSAKAVFQLCDSIKQFPELFKWFPEEMVLVINGVWHKLTPGGDRIVYNFLKNHITIITLSSILDSNDLRQLFTRLYKESYMLFNISKLVQDRYLLVSKGSDTKVYKLLENAVDLYNEYYNISKYEDTSWIEEFIVSNKPLKFSKLRVLLGKELANSNNKEGLFKEPLMLKGTQHELSKKASKAYKQYLEQVSELVSQGVGYEEALALSYVRVFFSK